MTLEGRREMLMASMKLDKAGGKQGVLCRLQTGLMHEVKVPARTLPLDA